MSSWPPILLPLALSRDCVHVVRIGLDVGDGRLAELQATLSADETARAERYKVPQPRRHFIVCRGALRQILGACLNCEAQQIEFEYGPHGKPSLKSPSTGLQFSVSHSGNQALIAISTDRRVGVDIERMDPSVRILKLAKRFFSARESAELLALPECDQLAGFYRGWTCKESYLKATGFGLSFPLSQFSVSLNPHQPGKLIEVVDQSDELERWQLLPLDPPRGYAAALLLEAKSSESLSLHPWLIRESLDSIVIDCADRQKIISAVDSVIMTRLERADFLAINHIKRGYMRLYGIDGVYERMNGRSVAQIISECTLPDLGRKKSYGTARLWRDMLVIAESNGVSEAQLMVMDIVRLHVPIHREQMAEWVLRYFDNASLDVINEAIDICIRDGWLRVLTADDVRSQPAFFSTYLKHFPSSAGLLDWTEAGNRLAKQIFGEKQVHPGS